MEKITKNVLVVAGVIIILGTGGFIGFNVIKNKRIRAEQVRLFNEDNNIIRALEEVKDPDMYRKFNKMYHDRLSDFANAKSNRKFNEAGVKLDELMHEINEYLCKHNEEIQQWFVPNENADDKTTTFDLRIAQFMYDTFDGLDQSDMVKYIIEKSSKCPDDIIKTVTEKDYNIIGDKIFKMLIDEFDMDPEFIRQNKLVSLTIKIYLKHSNETLKEVSALLKHYDDKYSDDKIFEEKENDNTEEEKEVKEETTTDDEENKEEEMNTKEEKEVKEETSVEDQEEAVTNDEENEEEKNDTKEEKEVRKNKKNKKDKKEKVVKDETSDEDETVKETNEEEAVTDEEEKEEEEVKEETNEVEEETSVEDREETITDDKENEKEEKNNTKEEEVRKNKKNKKDKKNKKKANKVEKEKCERDQDAVATDEEEKEVRKDRKKNKKRNKKRNKNKKMTKDESFKEKDNNENEEGECHNEVSNTTDEENCDDERFDKGLVKDICGVKVDFTDDDEDDEEDEYAEKDNLKKLLFNSMDEDDEDEDVENNVEPEIVECPTEADFEDSPRMAYFDMIEYRKDILNSTTYNIKERFQDFNDSIQILNTKEHYGYYHECLEVIFSILSLDEPEEHTLTRLDTFFKEFDKMVKPVIEKRKKDITTIAR